nr:hypothetical protein CFP56_09886 [Quercus suber]
MHESSVAGPIAAHRSCDELGGQLAASYWRPDHPSRSHMDDGRSRDAETRCMSQRGHGWTMLVGPGASECTFSAPDWMAWRPLNRSDLVMLILAQDG